MNNYFSRAFALIAICCGCSLAILAQSNQSSSSDEINRVEFFGGYSINRVASPYTNEELREVDALLSTTRGNQLQSSLGGAYVSNGANLSLTGNLTKYVGLKFDFSTHRSNQDFALGTVNLEQKHSLTNFLGGVQFKNNAKDGPRVKPFAHALVGAARQNIEIPGFVRAISTTTGLSESALRNAGITDLDEKQTNLAFAIGGGIDVRLNRRIDLRLIQIDYNPTRIRENDDFAGKLQSNVRFSFGIVIH